MKKLSVAQEKILNRIKYNIQCAKECSTFEEYYNKYIAQIVMVILILTKRQSKIILKKNFLENFNITMIY